MINRRTFLESLGALGMGATCLPSAWGEPDPSAESTPRRKLAVITTEWRYHSHAWHMAERFLVGYPRNGRWYHPPIDVVSAYVDQQPDNDLSHTLPSSPCPERLLFGTTHGSRGIDVPHRESSRSCRANPAHNRLGRSRCPIARQRSSST